VKAATLTARVDNPVTSHWTKPHGGSLTSGKLIRRLRISTSRFCRRRCVGGRGAGRRASQVGLNRANRLQRRRDQSHICGDARTRRRDRAYAIGGARDVGEQPRASVVIDERVEERIGGSAQSVDIHYHTVDIRCGGADAGDLRRQMSAAKKGGKDHRDDQQGRRHD
jgi:hypothetical protein